MNIKHQFRRAPIYFNIQFEIALTNRLPDLEGKEPLASEPLCPASEPLRRAIFGTISIFDLWSRPWDVVRLLSLQGIPPRPHPSEGVGLHHYRQEPLAVSDFILNNYLASCFSFGRKSSFWAKITCLFQSLHSEARNPKGRGPWNFPKLSYGKSGPGTKPSFFAVHPKET